MKTTLLVTAVLALSTEAFAEGDVVVTLTPAGEAFAAANGTSPQQLAASIDKRIDDLYQTYNVNGFLKSFANATSFSSRGLGVDYASNSDFVFGVGANVAVAVESFDGAKGYPVGGAATNISAMAGYNLKGFGLPRLTVFGNGFRHQASVDELRGALTSFGVHGQWKLIEDTHAGKLLFKWGGIDLTGGVEVTRWSLALQRGIKTELGADQNGDATLDATGRFDLSSNTVVFPFEATTSLRIAYLLSLYGGVGIDIQSGSTDVNASLDGKVSAINPVTNMREDIADATITMKGSQGPSVGKARGLVGLQVNLWKLKVVTQLNFLPPSTASVALGLRLAL